MPESEHDRVDRLFRLAMQTSDGFESYARQIGDAFKDEPALLEDVLDGLFHIAKADEAVHEAEYAYLKDVAAIFAFSDTDFERIAARHVQRKDDPYLILKADRSMSDEELKRHYRRLVAENHPDRDRPRPAAGSREDRNRARSRHQRRLGTHRRRAEHQVTA